MNRGLFLAAVLLATVAPLGACRSTDGAAGAPTAAVRPETPMRFRRLRGMLDAALVDAARGDAAALRARSPDLSNEGLALLKAVLPHDVARQDVPRYVEGRARFGDALKRWVTVVEGGTDAEVLDAIRRLDDAARGWVDAYLGLEPETAV